MNKSYLIVQGEGAGKIPKLTRLENVSVEYKNGYYKHMVDTYGENDLQISEI